MTNLIIETYAKALKNGMSAGLIMNKLSSLHTKLNFVQTKTANLYIKKMHSGQTDVPMRNFLLKNCDDFKRLPPADPRTSLQKNIEPLVQSLKTGIYHNSPAYIKKEENMEIILSNITISQKAICDLLNNIVLLLKAPDELIYKFDQYLAPLFRHAYNLDCNLALLPNFLATSKGVPRRDSRSLVGKIQVLFNHMPERERENLMGNLNYLCITLEAYIEEPSVRNYSKIQACVIDIKMSVCRITAKLTAQVRQDYDFQSRFPFPFNI